MTNFDGIPKTEVNVGRPDYKKPAEAVAAEKGSAFSQKLAASGLKEFTDSLFVSGVIQCADDYFYNKLEPEDQEKAFQILEKANAEINILLKDLKEKHTDMYFAYMSAEQKTQLNAIKKSTAKELNKII